MYMKALNKYHNKPEKTTTMYSFLHTFELLYQHRSEVPNGAGLTVAQWHKLAAVTPSLTCMAFSSTVDTISSLSN